VHMSRITGQLRAGGQLVRDEDLARVSPLAHAHSLAIFAQDRAVLARADGVGPRLAARIVNELKDKVSGLAPTPSMSAGPASAAVADSGQAADAVSALVNLEWGRAEAFAAVAAAMNRLGSGAGVDALIRAALRERVL
jgi:Holliday junction DNA helicase RuvA